MERKYLFSVTIVSLGDDGVVIPNPNLSDPHIIPYFKIRDASMGYSPRWFITDGYGNYWSTTGHPYYSTTRIGGARQFGDDFCRDKVIYVDADYQAIVNEKIKELMGSINPTPPMCQ